jgi:hypothetical protein
MLLLILMSLSAWNGCATRVLVVPDDQTESFLKKGETFHAPMDGVFMGQARYQRYRKAVADRIMELQNGATTSLSPK